MSLTIGEQFLFRIREVLTEEDDLDLWISAIGHILTDAGFLCENAATPQSVFTEIGRCSHWLRPHQTRWTADGGFAYPSGYGGGWGFSCRGLPEFDWSFCWQWNTEDQSWRATEKPSGKRRLQLRIAVPARSTRHDQAAVHTIWTPGSPSIPHRKARQFYGFRKQEQQWALTAHQGTDETIYH